LKASQKGRLRMPKWLLDCALLLTSIFAFAEEAGKRLTLTGEFTQGGLIVGKSSFPVEAVKLGDVKVPVHPNQKLFVFGFGRDAGDSDTLYVQFKDGLEFSKELEVEQRQYKIDKIEGVASKYVSPPESVLKRIRNDSKIVKDARASMSYRTDFILPVIKPAEGRISGVYGSQRVFNGVPKRPHFGMDIAAPTGTKVIAPWPGKVVLAEPDLYYSGGTLIIDHGLGVTSTYIHLSKLHVNKGQEITQGQKIADIGATGRVTGPHLDWRLNWFKRRLDPQLLLKQ